MHLNTLTSFPGALCATRLTLFWSLCLVFLVLNLVCAFYAAFYRTQIRDKFNIPGKKATLMNSKSATTSYLHNHHGRINMQAMDPINYIVISIKLRC